MKKIFILLLSISSLSLLLSCAKEQNCVIFTFTLLESRTLQVEMTRLVFLENPTSSNCVLFSEAQREFDKSANEYIDLASDCENIPADSVLYLQYGIRNDFGYDASESLKPLLHSAQELFLKYTQDMTQENCHIARAAYQAVLARAYLYNECYPSDEVENLIAPLESFVASFTC